jgi:hypothetical protein
MARRSIPSYVREIIFLSNGIPLSSFSAAIRHSSGEEPGKSPKRGSDGLDSEGMNIENLTAIQEKEGVRGIEGECVI